MRLFQAGLWIGVDVDSENMGNRELETCITSGESPTLN